ncbi:MAG: hypothetical protein J6A28_03990 [Clostridia bacterium]|nr:hypothetical protein [Clostridia bacterium]
MNVVGKFKNGTISILNLKSEDKLHFSFDINISTPVSSYSYHFGESVYFSMYEFLDGTRERICDEDSRDNYLELTKECFGIIINQEGVSAHVRLTFDMWEDQERLQDFLLELKATCEVLLQQ